MPPKSTNTEKQDEQSTARQTSQGRPENRPRDGGRGQSAVAATTGNTGNLSTAVSTSAVELRLQLEEREAQVTFLRRRTLEQAETIEAMRLERNQVQIELEAARRQTEQFEEVVNEKSRVQNELDAARRKVEELKHESQSRRKEDREVRESKWTPPHREHERRRFEGRRSPQPAVIQREAQLNTTRIVLPPPRRSPRPSPRRSFLAAPSDMESRSEATANEENEEERSRVTTTDVVMNSPPRQEATGQGEGSTRTVTGPPIIGKDSWSLKARDTIEAYREERNRLLKQFPLGLQKRLNRAHNDRLKTITSVEDEVVIRKNEWQRVFTRLRGDEKRKASATLDQLGNKLKKERKKQRQRRRAKGTDESPTTSADDSDDYSDEDERLQKHPQVNTPTRTPSRSPSPDPRDPRAVPTLTLRQDETEGVANEKASLAQRLETPEVDRPSSRVLLQDRMDRGTGPIQIGESVPRQFEDPQSHQDLERLRHWADRGLLLAQNILYVKHIEYGQALKSRKIIPAWAKWFEVAMQKTLPTWMSNRQEAHKKEKRERKSLKRERDPLYVGRPPLNDRSSVELWAEDALVHRDEHLEYNPVLRVVDERVYLPFLRAGLIARFTRPRAISNLPPTWSKTDYREWWMYHLLEIMGTREGYCDYRQAAGVQVAPTRNLRPYQRAVYGGTSREDIARHLAECGITDEDMADSFEWARAMLAWYVQYQRRGHQYESPQARSWAQLLRDVQSPGADWETTPRGWMLWYPVHPDDERQTATGNTDTMDPTLDDAPTTEIHGELISSESLSEAPGGGYTDPDYAPPSISENEGLDYGEEEEDCTVQFPPTEEMGPASGSGNL